MATSMKDQAQFLRAEDLGGLELLHARYHQQRFSRHSHEGYTVGVIERGAQQFYRSGGNHIAPVGSIILVNADQVHDGHRATDDGWAYRAVYPLPAMFDSVGPTPYFPEPVVQDPYLAGRLRHLFDVLEGSDNTLERETLFMVVLSELSARQGKTRRDPPPVARSPSAVSRVRDYLDAHAGDNVSLQELSVLVGLTPFHLARLFQRAIGLPPHAYQIQRRIQKAKTLIRLGVALAEVAVDCGFTDQSHLTRHFKRVMGVTPGLYLRRSRNAP